MEGLTFKKKDLLNGIQDVPVGSLLWVTITDQRNIGQNALMHKYFSTIAEDTGNSLKAVKLHLKEEFLGYEESTFTDKEGVEHTTRELRSTASLSEKEASTFITQIEAWAWHELGMTLNKGMYS